MAGPPSVPDALFQAYAKLLTELTERKPTRIQDLLEQAFSG